VNEPRCHARRWLRTDAWRIWPQHQWAKQNWREQWL
jgi:hypothetical protein